MLVSKAFMQLIPRVMHTVTVDRPLRAEPNVSIHDNDFERAGDLPKDRQQAREFPRVELEPERLIPKAQAEGLGS
jgi:hypothetical protein